MNVITLLNEKGGVGKTTLSLHIAAGLASKGHTVVVLDMDGQAHSTQYFGFDEAPGVYKLLVQDAEWKDVLVGVDPRQYGPDGLSAGELYILPSNTETRVIPMLVSEAGLLRERLTELAGWADYVVIDTSPTPSMLHAMIYVASDGVVYPTKMERLSLMGLNNSIRRMDNLNRERALWGLEPAKTMGIQPVMYDSQTNAHGLGMGQARSKFQKLVWNALPTRTLWRDASSQLQTIFAYDRARAEVKDEVMVQAMAFVERVEVGLLS